MLSLSLLLAVCSELLNDLHVTQDKQVSIKWYKVDLDFRNLWQKPLDGCQVVLSSNENPEASSAAVYSH